MPHSLSAQLPRTGMIAESWRVALPPDRAERVAKFIREVWESTCARKYDRFHMGENEPHLTRVLCNRLQTLKADKKLTGEFIREAPIDMMDEETGEFGISGRADIQYSSDRERNEIVVIFEFKKLRHKSADRSGYIDSGMLRFVKGIYGRRHYLGFMVGITNEADVEPSLSALRRSIQNPTKRRLLSLAEDNAGRLLRPSEPELADLVQFQTMHMRTIIGAPDIFLGHFFLNLVSRQDLRPKIEVDLDEPD